MKLKQSIFYIIIVVIFLMPGISYPSEGELPIFPSPILPEGFSQEKTSILLLHGKKPSDMVVFVRTLFKVPLKKVPSVGTTSVDLYYPIQTKEDMYSTEIPLQMFYGDVTLSLDRIDIRVTNKRRFFASDPRDRDAPTPTAPSFITIYPTMKEEIPENSIIKSLSGSLEVMCYIELIGKKMIMSCSAPGQSTVTDLRINL